MELYDKENYIVIGSCIESVFKTHRKETVYIDRSFPRLGGCKETGNKIYSLRLQIKSKFHTLDYKDEIARDLDHTRLTGLIKLLD